MNHILVPIDGSSSSSHALETGLQWLNNIPGLQLHVLTVQPPIASGNVKRFISAETLQQYYEEEAEKILAPVRQQLANTHPNVSIEWRVGHIAETIIEYAQQTHCDHILMGTRGMGGFSNLLLGSVASKVIAHSTAPVTLIK